MARAATGLDVGMRSGIALTGRVQGNTFKVSDFNVAAGTYRSLDEAWGSLGLNSKPKRGRIGLSGRDVNVRYSRVPRVPDWQLRKLMRFEVEEIGDQSGSEVASDFNLLPELPEIEGEDVVLLAMARESLLEEHANGLARLGGKLDCFSPSAIALYNAWARFGVVEDDTVLVASIGYENTDVMICRGPDLVFARNLSGGSRLFDTALAERFDVSPDKAEQIKIELASLAPGKSYATANHEKASRAILGAAGQLLSLLQSTVLFCKSQVKLSGLKVDRVLLCGGGAALDGLTAYLHSGMGVPVELFDPFRVVDVSGLSPDAAAELDEYKLESVVALGLATMASDADAYSLEILPSSLAKKRAFWGQTAWLVAAGLLAAAYLGFAGWQESRALDSAQAQSQTLSRSLRNANRVHNQARDLIDENVKLSELATQLEGIAGSGEQVARVLSVLDQEMPGDFWVTNLESLWGSDEELGVDRANERPIISIRGRVREGTDSPALLHQGMINGLEQKLGIAAAQLNQSMSPTGETFSIDLTQFAPPSPDVDEPDDAGGDEDTAGG